MDMKKLLEAVTKFAGEPEQKPGDQVRGTEVAKKGGKEHPFKGRLVGDSKDNMLKGLEQVAEDKSLEWELAEAYANFNEDDIGVEPKRPGRKSDRPDREYTKDGKPSKRYTTVNEYGKETDNFTADDIKELEGIKDLATLKARAFALISKPSKRPMKPEKVAWFKSRLDSLTTPMAVIKLMYDLLLSGEGQSVIGSRNSMGSNSYRGRFGESTGDNTFMGTVRNKKSGIEFDVKAAHPANREGERVSNLIYLVDKKTGKPVHKFMSSKDIERHYDWVRFPGKFSEGWESGPDEYKEPYDDADDAYDRQRQEKADAAAQAQQAKRPQTKVYTLTGRGPNMEPNYKFPGEYDSLDAASAARDRLMADPKTPNPRMIGISTHTKYLDEGWSGSGDRVHLPDEPATYYHGTGQLYKEYKELFDKLVPASGAADTIEGEVLRAASKIVYRHYNDGDEFNKASFDQLKPYIGHVTSYDDLAHKATMFALAAEGEYHPNTGWDCLDVMEYGPEFDDEDDGYDDYAEYPDDEDDLEEGMEGFAKAMAATRKEKRNSIPWPKEVPSDMSQEQDDEDEPHPPGHDDLDEDGVDEISSWGIPHNEWVEFEEVAEQALAAVQSNEAWEEFFQVADLDRLDKSMQQAIDYGLGSGSLEDFTTDVLNGLRAGYERYGTEPRAALDLTTFLLSRGIRKLSKPVVDEARADQVYTINTIRERMAGPSSTRSTSGTMAELLDYFGYTLETGKSYEHERGRYKINMAPKNIQSLVDNLNKAKSNAASNGHSSTYYEVAEAEQIAESYHKYSVKNPDGRGGVYHKAEPGYTDEVIAKDIAYAKRMNPHATIVATKDGKPFDWESVLSEGMNSYPTDANWDRSGQMDSLVAGTGPSRTRKDPKSTKNDLAVANWQTKKAIKDRKAKGVHKKVAIPEGIESTDPVEGAVLSAVQELIQQGHTEVAPEVITNMVVAATSQPFLLKDLVDANKNSPAIQHYVDSINPTKVKFSSDILTVKNENPAKEKQQSQAGVSAMASRAASRPRLGESALSDKDDYVAKSKTLHDLSLNKDVDQEVVRQRKLDLDKEARAKGIKESKTVPVITAFRRGMEKIASSDMNPQAKQAAFDRLSAEFHKNAQAYSDAIKSKRKVTEYGANQPAGTAAPGVAQQQASAGSTDPNVKMQAQKVATATNALKSATGSTAPATNIAKAIDAATQGKAVGQQDMKALEPVMDVVGAAAQDPKLAQQFRTLATQAKQSQQQQPK